MLIGSVCARIRAQDGGFAFIIAARHVLVARAARTNRLRGPGSGRKDPDLAAWLAGARAVQTREDEIVALRLRLDRAIERVTNASVQNRLGGISPARFPSSGGPGYCGGGKGELP